MAHFGVVIRCDAGGTYGLGHAARCLTLARALREQMGEVSFVTQPGVPAGRDFIAAQGFAAVSSPAAAGSEADASFVRVALGGIRQPTILVLDSRDLSANEVERYSGAALTICIDDDNVRDFSSDMLVNSHPWAKTAGYSSRADRVLMLGPEYNLVAPAFFGIAARRDPQRPVSRVLITMGGEDPGNHTSRVIEALAARLAPLNVDIVIGPSHPEPQAVERSAARNLPKAALHRAPRGLIDLIARADVAITAGGTTCYELAAARVPAAAIPVEPHQIPWIDSLEREGTLLRLDQDGAISPAVFDRLLDDAALRVAMASEAAKLMPGSGAPVIAARVKSLLAERAVA